MTTTRLLVLVVGAVSCSTGDATDTSVPWKTTFATVGDTIVASTTGDVPDRPRPSCLPLLLSLIVGLLQPRRSRGTNGNH